MTELLFEIHRWVGYLVAVVVLFAAMMAFGRAKDAREFDAVPYRLAMWLLTLQVLVGLVLYGVGGYWDARPEIAYVHPVLALVALGLGHASVGRARKQRMAVDAHRAAGRGLVFSLVFVLAAILIATIPGFL